MRVIPQLRKSTLQDLQLIDTVGKNGGYMMMNGAVIDDAKPENVKAMIDFTKEYGVYK